MSITRFLEQFYPDPAEPIWLRTFDAKGLPAGVHGYPQNIQTCIEQLRTDLGFQQRLRTINEKQGIYFVVNAGGTHDKDITRINAVFCEMDDRALIQQHDIYDNESPLSPSIRIQTKKSVHAYWLLAEPITNEQFLALQKGLIKFFSSDTAIKNLSRVMRVPFFKHVSFNEGYKYQPITLHTFNPDWRYTPAELQEAFPYIQLVRAIPEWQPSGRMETLEDVKTELRARIMSMDSWSVSGQWGCANGVCHNGDGPTGLRINLVSGSVTCWSNCSLQKILAAFGLELPRSRKFEYIQRREQKSELYRWYQERKAL